MASNIVDVACLDDWLAMQRRLPDMMFRVDSVSKVVSRGGFVVPHANAAYFTGRGGLHFWVTIEDAIEYAREHAEDYIFACPRVRVAKTVVWSRDVMMAQELALVHTLFRHVDGYAGVRKFRDELVYAGAPGSVFAPSVLIRIRAVKKVET